MHIYVDMYMLTHACICVHGHTCMYMCTWPHTCCTKLCCFPVQFDHDHYGELSGGLQWLEGKRSANKGQRKRRSHKETPSGRGLHDEDNDVIFAGFGMDEEEDSPDVVEKLQVRGGKRRRVGEDGSPSLQKGDTH